jgi:hypothetical protein
MRRKSSGGRATMAAGRGGGGSGRAASLSLSFAARACSRRPSTHTHTPRGRAPSAPSPPSLPHKRARPTPQNQPPRPRHKKDGRAERSHARAPSSPQRAFSGPPRPRYYPRTRGSFLIPRERDAQERHLAPLSRAQEGIKPKAASEAEGSLFLAPVSARARVLLPLSLWAHLPADRTRHHHHQPKMAGPKGETYR